MKPREEPEDRSNAVNNGFWDKHPQERADAMERACERGNAANFFDLSPEERSRAYED